MTRTGRWSIVLAGGEGERLRPFIQRWLGQHLPKQYCTFVGTRSMFQHTLDRAATVTGKDRVVSVVARGHRREAFAQVEGRGGTLLLQPDNRDTAAGIFLPLTHLRARDPGATVVLFPSDHFVAPESRFLEVVQQAILAAEWLGDRLVLLGVRPHNLELDYGWIRPGRDLLQSKGTRVRTVSSFVEKPDQALAMRTGLAGGLWNTLVLAAKVETLWELGWQCFPDMMPCFEQIEQAMGSSLESRVLDAAYRQMPVRNFSSSLLQRAPERVAVIELSEVLWSDWGRPERIAATLKALEKAPAFAAHHLEPVHPEAV